METYEFKKIVETLKGCGNPVSHPLLLPVIVLCSELSTKNDETQREQRRVLRNLENSLTQRYKMEPAAGYTPQTDPELDDISRQLANCQCMVLQKRPQAWQNVVKRTRSALQFYWDELSTAEKSPELKDLHETLESRLDFLSVKLEGHEHYAHVSLERLNVHREVVSLKIYLRRRRKTAQFSCSPSDYLESCKWTPDSKIVSDSTSSASQHHQPTRVKTQSGDRDPGTKAGGSKCTREYVNENADDTWSCISPRYLSIICVRHAVLQVRPR